METTINKDLSQANLCKEKSNMVEDTDEPLESARSEIVSDNKEVSIQTDFPPEFQSLLAQGSPIMVMFDELKAIRARLDTVDKIESTTSSLDKFCKKVEERTKKLEATVKSNTASIKDLKTEVKSVTTEIKGIKTTITEIKSTTTEIKGIKGTVAANTDKVKEVNTELASLRKTVELQGRAIAKLTTLKADLLKQNQEVKSDLIKQNQDIKTDLIQKNKGITGEMNKLLDQQKAQVEGFHNTTQRVEKKILEKTEEKIEEKIEKVSQDLSFEQLRKQAYDNRYNVIILGLEEDSGKSVKSTVINLFKKLGEEKLSIIDAYRLGPDRSDPSYQRPIKVRFSQVIERNKIWRKRNSIPVEEGARKIKIQADLPKELREETNILYRITRAAANNKNFKSMSIRNYAIVLNGKEYTTRELEKLPSPIRPTSISNPRSNDAIVFFSKYSALSNHHPSPFCEQGETFQHMEQYLAAKRAQLSGRDDLIQRAASANDPKVAKAILHSLRDDHPTEWEQQVQEITVKGLRAKFSQNKHLLTFLKETGQLQIGEASNNPRWGIGLELENPDVLDTSKWNTAGNLLGKSLMKIRAELCSPSQPTEN